MISAHDDYMLSKHQDPDSEGVVDDSDEGYPLLPRDDLEDDLGDEDEDADMSVDKESE